MFDVVMSLYNKEAFVRATVESVLAQKYRDWRLFVVDDGSSDGGPDIVRGFADPRIALIHQRNQGVGLARNAGIAAGSAKWIAFLDADDLWRPEHLQELSGLIAEFPQAVLAGCSFARFSGAPEPRAATKRPGDHRLARYFADCARGRELFFTSSAAVRRSAVEAIGGFLPLPGNEDVELWARLALHGPVAVSGRTTVDYRLATGGITDAGMGGRKPAPRPLTREQMSSTIPTLTRLLPTVTDAGLRRDIVAYMDSRVGLSLIEAVREGDIARARHVRSLYEGTPKGRAGLAALLAACPAPLGRAIVATALGVQRLSRRLRG